MEAPDLILRPGWRSALEDCLRALRARFGADLVSVVAFGSRVRGNPHAESDLDLLVIVRGLPPSRLERQRLFLALAREVSEEFADAVMPVLLTPEDAATVKPFYLGMLDAHRTLVDADGFFAGVLGRLRARLAELGARRLVDDDGFEYWDLKPDWKPGDVVVL